jgi:hypothetical protein
MKKKPYKSYNAPGQGRKPLPPDEKKIQIGVSIRKCDIETFGGRKAVLQHLTKYFEEYFKNNFLIK